ncbi:MAG: DUF2062 domain-containing protein [Alphaproteobacteria bacterium]|nr:DUF2062 domain-containing protein [Alphaproteobacteria bacterium]
MFKRRIPLTFFQNLKEILWPSMGWPRAFKYVQRRVIRISDNSKKIAAGLAFGAVISFTPIVGTHIIQAGLLAYIFRANVVAAAIGTLVGNPWTFPFMWWAAISFGSFLFGLFGLPASTNLPEAMNFSIFWDVMRHEPLRVFLPWCMGGYLIALLSWPFFYYLFYYPVKAAKIARRKARLRKALKTAREVTEKKTK